MMTANKRNGFTLVEMLMVMVIISAILIMLVGYTTSKMDQFKREKTALLLQQIANAAQSYYLNYGKWPTSTPCYSSALHYNWTIYGPQHPLVSSGYLLTAPTFVVVQNAITSYPNPYGSTTFTSCTPTGQYIIETQIPSNSSSIASIIAGMLPGAVPNLVDSALNSAGLGVTVLVPVPGQNLNNARSVNFGSIYHSGACVPVPTCPSTMSPEILVTPAAVSGVSYPPNNCTNPKDFTTCSYNTYPVTSYTSYVVGGNTGMDSASVPACTNGTVEACVKNTTSNAAVTSGNYWRVCLQVASQDRVIQVSNTTGVTPPPTGNCSGQDCSTAWGQALGSIVAITRCQPGPSTAPTENVGSDFTVWQK
jgi:prepilin-type N-terminal cleavage/methylation domain-containing protein